MVLKQRQSERTVREQRTPYQALFEHTTDAVFILSLEQAILNINPQAASMLGYEADKLIGKRIIQIIPPEEQKNRQRMFKALLIDHFLAICQCTFRRSDGTKILVEVSVALVNETQSKPLCIQCIVRETTEQKQTEQALRESEIRYCAVVGDQNELICRYRPNGSLSLVNDIYCWYFAKRKEELLGRTFMSLIPNEGHERVKKLILAPNRENLLIAYEYRIINPMGNLPGYNGSFGRC